MAGVIIASAVIAAGTAVYTQHRQEVAMKKAAARQQMQKKADAYEVLQAYSEPDQGNMMSSDDFGEGL